MRAFSRPVRLMLAMALVSCIGSGLTYPFLLIYLHEVRHVSLVLTGLLIALPGVVGLLMTPWTGSLIDAVGPRAVLSGAALAAAVGSALMPTVRGALSAVAPLVLIGIGTSGIANSVNTLFAQLIPDLVVQARAFALNFMLVNLGLAGGTLASATIVTVHRPGSFTIIYLLDALSFVVPAIAAPLLPLELPRVRPARSGAPRPLGRRGRALGEDGPAPRVRRWAAWQQVLGNQAFLRYVLALGLIYLVGYGAIDTGFVGFSVTVVHVGPSVVAESFAANFIVIICLQPFVTRIVEHLRRSTALTITAGAFALAWLIEWSASQFHGVGPKALVIAFGAVFAIGEMTLSPVRNVLVNALATEELRGRYNAASWSVIQTTKIAAPALIGLMLGASLGSQLILGLVALAVVATFGAMRLGRQLSPEQDNRPLAMAVVGVAAGGPDAGEAKTSLPG